MKLARTDLANIVSPARAPDESLVTIIANKVESDPHLSAQKPANSILHGHCRVHIESLFDGCPGDEISPFTMDTRHIDMITKSHMR
jgi:hypothetical protein